ncbi:N-acetylglucosamine-6-phosphate deacetylase [Clavibacter lycopersici]|uniref:N-acetylglucosamine-6-phosphate deacetylase n=1 Tax=Clavibacter lycopersici TaxID=2301718 RepID=UPI001F3FE21C|nr:amidohydrolase family protein [Clavibacter lycopersici]
MSASTLIEAARLVDGAGHDGPGWLLVRDGRIADAGAGPAPDRAAATRLRLDTVIPGFVDTHVHGAVGVDFATPGLDPEPAVAHHARAGSTRVVASLATGAWGSTTRRLRELAPLVADGTLAGLHLEGPFLSPARRGAHDPSLLRAFAPGDVDEALAAADGALSMVTIAPELPGALPAIRAFVAAGVVVAIGHTDAPADVVRQAVDAGASAATHVFNGMPPLHHRSAGPVGVALSTDALVLELIADGHHVDDTAVDVVRAAARGRYALVSDAMSATGLADGSYELAGSAVVVADGVAMLADGSSLAGSTTPVGGAVARLLDRGVPLDEVVAATSATPARSLGLADPALVAGARADLVELRGARVARVMGGGSWLA